MSCIMLAERGLSTQNVFVSLIALIISHFYLGAHDRHYVFYQSSAPAEN